MKINEQPFHLILPLVKKASRDRKAPIWVRITVDGEHSEISLGQKLLPGILGLEQENVNIEAHPQKKEAA